MAKFLLWKPEYQNLNPWHSCKKSVRAVHACNASTGEAKTGGSRFSDSKTKVERHKGGHQTLVHVLPACVPLCAHTRMSTMPLGDKKLGEPLVEMLSAPDKTSLCGTCLQLALKPSEGYTGLHVAAWKTYYSSMAVLLMYTDRCSSYKYII